MLLSHDLQALGIRLSGATEAFEDLLDIFRVDQDLVVQVRLGKRRDDLQGQNYAGENSTGNQENVSKHVR